MNAPCDDVLVWDFDLGLCKPGKSMCRYEVWLPNLELGWRAGQALMASVEGEPKPSKPKREVKYERSKQA